MPCVSLLMLKEACKDLASTVPPEHIATPRPTQFGTQGGYGHRKSSRLSEAHPLVTAREVVFPNASPAFTGGRIGRRMWPFGPKQLANSIYRLNLALRVRLIMQE